MSDRVFSIKRQPMENAPRHFSWVVYFRGKRVAAYLKWARAMEHVETCVRRFGRGYL